jgi:hypothetical protein
MSAVLSLWRILEVVGVADTNGQDNPFKLFASEGK